MIQNIYKQIRDSLSEKNKGRVSRLLISSGLKPTVNRKVNSSLKRGTIVFSADFEMAWAFRFSRTRHREAVEMGMTERQNIPELLKLFEKNSIPVTWATVGHLFLDRCSREDNGVPHPEMPRPGFFENINWSYTSGDWYRHDPCSDCLSEPAWYAADLIDLIINSRVKHEIGCHSFSHTDFTYKNCSPNLAEAELDACIKASSKNKIELRSMVFPGGTAGNFETLNKKGVICYRKPMKHHIDLPFIDKHGLVAIPSSLGLERDPFGWSADFHLKMIRKFIEKAARHRLVCHFWFHPSMDKWYLENVMPGILEMAAEYRDSERVDVKTMANLALDIKSNSTITAQSKALRTRSGMH